MNLSFASAALVLCLLTGIESVIAAPYECPSGSFFVKKDNDQFCLFYFRVPESSDVRPYCGYLNNGYIGFSWPINDDVNYRCPTSARQTTNGSDLNFCVFENMQLPQANSLQSYCDDFAKGYVGFSWSSAGK